MNSKAKIILAFLILAVSAYVLWPRQRGSLLSSGVRNEPAGRPVLIEPTYELTETGRRVARIDLARLTQWCRAWDLPDPPQIEASEAAVLTALIDGLRAVTAERSGRTLGRLGRICAAIGAHQNAERYFLLAGQADPEDFRWPYHLACTYQSTGRDQAAIKAFSTVLGLNPDYPVTYARLGQLYLQAGRRNEAERMWRLYTQKRPEDSLGHIGLGRVALRRKDYEHALIHLTEALRRGPNDFQAHYYLGRAYAGTGQEESARRHYAISRELPQGAWFHLRDPLDQELRRAAGSVQELIWELERLKGSGDFARLARLAEQIIQRRPHDQTMMGNLASLYRKLKRYDDAHAMLDRGLAISPESLRLGTGRAALFLAEGKLEEALTAADAVLRVDPQSATAHSIRGRALLILSRSLEAEEAIRRALSLDPADVGTHFVLGEVLRARGDLAAAARCFERVLDLRPGYGPAEQRLAEITQQK